MLPTKQPVLRRFWYAVMPLVHLNAGPKPFRLLGEDLVLWKTTDGQIVCLEDRCCHRTAKLSRGYLEEDTIVCGYHGWTFDAKGSCVHIPQQADRAPPPRAVVRKYPAAEKYGYVWVALDDNPLSGIPDLPEHDQAGYRKIDQFYEVWNIGAFRMLENAFDTAHIAFTHRNSINAGVKRAGRLPTIGANTKKPILYNEIQARDYGFDITTDPRPNGEQLQLNAGPDGARSQNNYSNWFMPFARRTSLHYANGLVHIFITCATPIDDDRTMIVQWIYRNDTEADVPATEVNAFDRKVIDEDKYILESCDADVPLATRDGEEMHMVSDRPSVTMRRMLTDLLQAHGEVEQRSDNQARRRRLTQEEPVGS
jgi:phenylpropionate dioxygenase-like ring-hydroxylating dioxygenase large terminal subunit